ncbi:MAG TPA: copper transporter [Gaiellaceae bacterium]
MFDLRYHVASLAAVFLALIIGILVGAGLAARTDVKDVDRQVLEGQIERLDRQNKDLSAEADLLRSKQEASDAYVNETYEVVMDGRLRGKNVALLFVGQSDDDVQGAVEQTLSDASAPGIVEMEALELPVDPQEVKGALDPQFSQLTLEEIGRRLAEELVKGGETPFWDALTPILVQDHQGTTNVPADAVVVSHTGIATNAPTRQFLDGLYAGLRRASVPVVGVERTDERLSRIAVYKANGLSSVDSIDTNVGKVALAGLLAGGPEGHYGLKRTADSGALPPIEPLPLAPLPGG